MDHDRMTCSICLRNDRLKFDPKGGFHFMPHDSEAGFPLFKLYPVAPNAGCSDQTRPTSVLEHR
jgi:hypothetical protein